MRLRPVVGHHAKETKAGRPQGGAKEAKEAKEGRQPQSHLTSTLWQNNCPPSWDCRQAAAVAAVAAVPVGLAAAKATLLPR